MMYLFNIPFSDCLKKISPLLFESTNHSLYRKIKCSCGFLLNQSNSKRSHWQNLCIRLSFLISRMFMQTPHIITKVRVCIISPIHDILHKSQISLQIRFALNRHLAPFLHTLHLIPILQKLHPRSMHFQIAMILIAIPFNHC